MARQTLIYTLRTAGCPVDPGYLASFYTDLARFDEDIGSLRQQGLVSQVKNQLQWSGS